MKVESRMSETASIFSFYILVIFWDRYPLSLLAHLDFVRLYAMKVGRAFQGKYVGNGDFHVLTVLPTL